MPKSVVTVLFSILAIAWFNSPAAAAPLTFSDRDVPSAALMVGLKCNRVDGQLVCAHPDGSGKHHNNDGHQKDDDDQHHKKKHNDEDTGLTNCSIQPANGGGGCTAPLKYKCEELKSGKKCCGCVGDKGAVPPAKQVQNKHECATGKVPASALPLYRNTCAQNHFGAIPTCTVDLDADANAPPQYTCCCDWKE